MDWFKTYQDGILRGSLATSDTLTQLIWVKLLAIENETRLRDGWLHYKKGSPMPREYLAMVCNVTVEELDVAIETFLGDIDTDGHARIEIASDGDIFIKNWEKYQHKPEKVLVKEAAIEKAKETKRRTEAVLESMMATANRLNQGLDNIRYVIKDGKIWDTKTGEEKTVEEVSE